MRKLGTLSDLFAVKNKTNKKTIGDKAEKRALQYLRSCGLGLLQQNYSSRFGEIDLIMQDTRGDESTIVFIEVKYRSSADFGGGLASITHSKQEKLRKTALLFLQKHHSHDQACRFDVIVVSGAMRKHEISWIENAF